MSKSSAAESAEGMIKNLLPDPNDRITLDDHITHLLRTAIETVTADAFWDCLPEVNADGIQRRLTQYEQAMSDLLVAVILLGRWGRADQVVILEKILLRLAEANKSSGGLVVWQSMRWYPICLLMYGAGIAALSVRNYPILTALYQTRISSSTRSSGRDALVVRVLDEMNEINNTFKALPAHARDRVPRSEYVFNLLRPALDRLLFLGESYERCFDEFEIISALVYADVTAKERGRVWAMPGRFGYKSCSSGSPIHMFIADAESGGEDMPLLKIGLFASSVMRFKEVTSAYVELLAQMNWF